MTFRLEPLVDHHDLNGFDCGKPELDDWFRDHARTVTGQGTRTYVRVDDDDQLAGYFSVAPHTMQRDQLSKKSGRGAPSHPT